MKGPKNSRKKKKTTRAPVTRRARSRTKRKRSSKTEQLLKLLRDFKKESGSTKRSPEELIAAKEIRKLLSGIDSGAGIPQGPENDESDEARRSDQGSKYKSEFLANMSHELRTPLNSLQILARELVKNKEGNLSEKQIQYIRTIIVCGEELVELINDILDLSKIEAGYISVHSAPINITEIKRYVENAFRPLSESKHLCLKVETDENLPRSIHTDSQRLNQILKNLLSNAFKFTEKGHVHVRIYKAQKNWRTQQPVLNDAESVIAFEISDTGIGIPPGKQKVIFDAFRQAEGSTSRKYGGTGLGLSISRGLSSLLGGALELESTPGVGSKFTLFLPAMFPQSHSNKNTEVTLEDVAPDKSEVESSINALKGKRVLIIDDDVRNLYALTTVLEQFGLRILVAEGGSEAIEMLNKEKEIDLVLVDIMMPGMDGYETTGRIREQDALKHLPVIAVTAKAMKGDREKCIDAGASDYITKPVDVDRLAVMMNNWINLRKN